MRRVRFRLETAAFQHETGNRAGHYARVIEMAVGVAILTFATRVGAWIAMVWLIGIAINLASTGMFLDLAVRDLEIAVAAYVLARLTEAREAQPIAAAVNAGDVGTIFKGGLV